MLPRALLCAAALLGLAGCAGDPATVDPATGADAASPLDAGSAPLDASSSVAAPQWQVGQWWEWEISFADRVADWTYCSIVVEASTSGYTLATERLVTAKDEAAFGQPLLGAIGKGDLAMDGWGSAAPWSLLSFPLTDGKTWAATMPNIAWDIVPSETVDLAMAATFDASLGDGSGGYRLTGKSGEHTLVLADYVPAVGWFSALRFYDVDPGQEGLEVGYRAKSFGGNYTGPYFQASATLLLDWFDGSGFDDMPTEGGEPFADPNPYTDFTMEGGEGHSLFGYVVAETVVGARGVLLVDPANEQRAFESHEAQLQGHEAGLFLDEPAIAGTWRLATAGAGGHTNASARLYEVVVAEMAL